MSHGGGRGPGAGAARAAALALTLLVAAPILVPLVPTAEAQLPSDPWWGPTDRQAPTNGWAVRVPVTVENTLDYTITEAYVTVDVDFGKLLVKAGWTNRTVGSDVGLRGFTLDVDSIRVVEYGRGFSPGPINGAATLPIPHRFYPGLFGASRSRDFDPARNPAGTVLFHPDGSLVPGAKRFFYIYANPLEYTKTPPLKPVTLEASAPIDAYLWGTGGQTFYGFEPLQDGVNHAIEVVALTNLPTYVTFYQGSFGRFTPIASSEQYPNPSTIQPAFFGPVPGTMTFQLHDNTPWKLVADRPVMVMAHGLSADDPLPPGTTDKAIAPWRGFLPATSGTFLGTDFYVYGGSTHAGAPNKNLPVMIIKGPGSGSVLVTARTTAFPPGPSGTIANDLTLTAGTPTGRIGVKQGAWTHIHATGKVLAFMGGLATTDQPFFPHQVPALTGGPAGTDFMVDIPVDGGTLDLCARDANATLRVVDDAHPSTQLEPDGTVSTSDPLLVPASTVCRQISATPTYPRDSFIDVYSVKDAAGGDPQPITMMAGADAGHRNLGSNARPFLGSYGGLGAQSFYTQGPIGVFGHFNDTKVTLFVEREHNGAKYTTNQTFSLSVDGYQAFEQTQFPEATGRFFVRSTKPISVSSLNPTGNNAYSFIVPGRPESPKVTLGPAEFRGPLVELRSREKDGRQDFRSTGPGSPVSFPMEIANLGHWLGGEGLADAITLTCSSLAGWTVDGCGRTYTLASNTAERVDVTITPPADAVNVNGTFQLEARSRSGQVASTFKLIVFVEIRYGVQLSFDVEGNTKKTIDPPIGVDPGETYRYNVIIKNTGSARDTFDVGAEPEPAPGWKQALLLDGEPVKVVTLEGGESRLLQFAVTAPNTESAQQNIVSIKAQSHSSALAGDIVNTATRIRPKVSIEMVLDPTTRVVEPNATAKFNVTLRNFGNDNFDVAVKREGFLPNGWNASFNIEPPEVIVPPDQGHTLDPNLSYTFVLSVTPPLGARAGDLAALKLTAEVDSGGAVKIPGDQASAVVVVRRIHNVTATNLLDTRAGPGEELRYVLPVTNRGNGNDVLELLPGSATPAWSVEPGGDSVFLDSNETGELPLLIRVPDGTAPGPYNLTFTLRLSREAFQNLTIPITIDPTPRLAFSGAANVSFAPGRPREIGVVVTNTGNLEGAYALAAEGPAAWNATFRPARVQLAPGGSIPVTLVVNASKDAPDGDVDVRLAATLDEAPAGSTLLRVTLARPDLKLEKIESSGTTRPGDLVLVSATVRNSGGIAAENVSVALVVDGTAVDQVTLTRIPVGDSKIATLSWVATKRTTDVKVVVDPKSEIVQKTAGEDAASVSFSSTLLPVPGFGLAPLALAFALALALVRRRRS